MYGHRAESHGRTAAILMPAGCAGLLYLFGAFSVVAVLPSGSGDEILPFLVMGLMLAIPFGFLLALLPMVVGVLVMSRLGESSEDLRHPAAWGFAGFAMSAALLILFGVTDIAGGPALLFTGTCCALLARGRVRWTDLDVQPEEL